MQPHPSTPAAAAKSTVPVALRFFELGARDGPADITGRLIHLVISTQITGIVDRHFIRYGILEGDSVVTDQIRDKFGGMDHLQLASKLRIFIFQGIQTMGTHGDDFFNPVAIKPLDVRPGQLLKKDLITQSSGRVTAANFFFPQYGKPDTGGVENLHHGPAGLQVSGMKRTGASDP